MKMRATAKDTMQLIPAKTTRSMSTVFLLPALQNVLHGRVLTYYDLVWHPLRNRFEVLKGRQDALDIAKHGGEAQEEQHDKEQYGPDLRARHR